jgi:hypothetical protein
VLVDDGTEQCSVAGIDVGLTINGDSILIEEFLAITENNRVTADDLPKLEESQRQRSGDHSRSEQLRAPLEEIATAVEAIPNEKLPWDEWNNVGMAIFTACGRSDDGFAIFDKFSTKYPGYIARDTKDRWEAYHGCPPNRIGMGSLVHLADQADPDWRDKKTQKPRPLPVILDAGDDLELPPPRAWLLGNVFRRKFLSSLFKDGGVGKTALRYAQYLPLATGHSLTGEHVFQRCRVLMISFEDDLDELRRRIWAVRLFYKITLEEVKGWLFYWSAKATDGKLMVLDRFGNPRVGDLKDSVEALIVQHNFDLIGVDPFIKSHGVGENNNVAIDMVAQVLTDMCAQYNIATGIPHHVSKPPKGGDN